MFTLLRNTTVKEFKNTQDHFFKYIKKYYKNDAKMFKFSKEVADVLTLSKIKKMTLGLIEDYDILYFRWNQVEEVKPAQSRGWNQPQRDRINNYDLKNDWSFKNSSDFIIIESLYNNHNKNGFDAGYIQKLYKNKYDFLKNEATKIRYNREQEQKKQERARAEAATAEFKKDYSIKLNRIIKATCDVELIKPDDRMELSKKLITFKNNLLDKNIIDLKIRKLLLTCDLFKEYQTTVRTAAEHGDRVYITTFKTSLLNYFLKGCYSLMLENFKACNGCEWYNNTRAFEIIETDAPLDIEIIKHNYF